MKVARYYSHDDVRLEEMPLPEIGPGELLVQVKACGVCASDAVEWYLKLKGPPLVLGHEPSGVVAQIGEGVERFAVGDRVFVHHHVPCFVCHYCRRGHYTMCSTFKETNIYPGGFAEYIRVPALNVQRDVLKLPDDLSFEEATFIEPAACCIKAIKKANIQPGDTVVIIGAGLTGLLHLQLARIWGAAVVIVTDFVDFRLEMAQRLGADFTINPSRQAVLTRLRELNEGRGADMVIVTPGSVKAMEDGLALAGKGATVHLFAPSAPEAVLPVRPNRLFSSEITITASYSCTPLETRTALKFIRRGRIKVQELITHRFGLHQVGRAIELIIQAQESLKILVVPDILKGVSHE